MAAGKWLPLESNPDMLTAYVRAVGVERPACFVDIWSFDDESVKLFPKPMLAVCALYPMAAVDPPRLERHRGAFLPSDGVEGLVYVRQKLDVHGNACGSIAAVHAVCNNADRLALAEASPMLAFARENAGKPADASGAALERATALHEASESAARLGQTETPDADDDVEYHFVTFVRHNGRLLELDGLKPGPLDHGPVAEDELLERAVAIIRDEMMPLANGVITFSAVGLVPADPDADA